MASKRNKVAPAKAPEPQHHTCHREVRVPHWHRVEWGSVQHSTHSVRQWRDEVLAGGLRLPAFQRPYVWTDEQITRFWDSMLQGYHVGSLLVWEQYRLPASVERFAGHPVECGPGSARVVVDGQQRLGAVVALLLSGRWYFDMECLAVTTEPGPWRMPGTVALATYSVVNDWATAHSEQYGVPRYDVRDAAIMLRDVLDRCYLGSVRLDGPRDWPLDRVMESYRRMASEGTPHDLAELEAALRRATAAP